jgi:hypothetical protein
VVAAGAALATGAVIGAGAAAINHGQKKKAEHDEKNEK